MIPAVKEPVMKAPKQNCPRCNSEQSFRPLTEDLGNGRISVYIRCTTCRWSRELRESTRELERLTRDERRLLEQARIQHERLGTVNGATRRLLANTRTAMQREREVAGL
jgi:hypothetical protein